MGAGRILLLPKVWRGPLGAASLCGGTPLLPRQGGVGTIGPFPWDFLGGFAHRETCTGVCFYFPSPNTPHGWLLTPNTNPRDPPPKVGRELSLVVDVAGGPPGAGRGMSSAWHYPSSLWGGGKKAGAGRRCVGGQAAWQALGGSAFPACLLPDFYFQCAISIKDLNNHFPRT